MELDEQFHPDCGCWVKHQPACPFGTNPYDCCEFELITYSTPYVNRSGTTFSYTKNFTKGTIWMCKQHFFILCVVSIYQFFIVVLPNPKGLEPPHNLTTAVGSKAVFTCDFEAATDNEISQIHWLFNGKDLAGCSRFKDSINCTVTQQSTNKTNYISSNLTIYSVKADNAGQYTCYCSYNTNLLNVDGVQVIESKHKSATLSVVASGGEPEKKLYMIIGICTGVFIIIIIVLIVVLKMFHHKHRRSNNTDYRPLELTEMGKLYIAKCVEKELRSLILCII